MPYSGHGCCFGETLTCSLSAASGLANVLSGVLSTAPMRYRDPVRGTAKRVSMRRLAVSAWVLAAVALGAPAYSQSPMPEAPGPELRGHGGPVRALAALPDGRLASGGFDSTIIIWDLARGQAAHVLRQHETAVNALVARPDGCVVSGGEDARIKVWCETGAPANAIFTGHQGAVSALALSRDSTLISGSWDKTVRVWNAQGTPRTLTEHAGPVTSLLVTNDGAVLSTSHDGTAKLTPLQGNKHGIGLARQLKLEAPITSAVQLPDGRFLLACADGSLREVDAQLTAARPVAQLEGPLTAVVISKDGKTAATGGLRTPVTLIDLSDAAGKPVPLGNALPFWAMTYSRDGREILTGGNDRAVRRFDAVTGSPLAPTIPKPAPTAIADAKDRGAKVFRACAVCHGLTADTHLAGPTLHQIMGRKIASLKGYEYSGPLAKLDITWTPETIARLFEVGPAQFTPGTKMPEQRLTDPDDRQALVEWLSRVTVP
jgi:cytochrome c